MTTPKKKRSKRPMTITEMARMGGKATAKKRTAKQRKEAARNAAKARWARKAKKGSA
jgi:hypothetical protein